MAFAALLLTPFRGACISELSVGAPDPERIKQSAPACDHFNAGLRLMNISSMCRNAPGASALSHEQSKRPELGRAAQTRIRGQKLMLAKFKTSLVEGPAAIEKRRRRQAIAAARAERACSVKKRGNARNANLQSKPRLLRRQQPNRPNEMRCWRLNRRRPAMPVTRHGRRQRKSGGVTTKPKPGASPPISLSCRTC